MGQETLAKPPSPQRKTSRARLSPRTVYFSGLILFIPFILSSLSASTPQSREKTFDRINRINKINRMDGMRRKTGKQRI
jgi:hypothetical protein